MFMGTIENEIMITDKVICRYLDEIEDSTRGIISQDILAHLKNLVEHVMLKYYSPNVDIEDSEENIEKAVEHAQTDSRLKVLYRFRNYLDIVASHYTLDEDSSERLMLKYYDYMLETKNLLYEDFHITILHNLDKFPLNLDTALQEYYSKIAEKINQYDVDFVGAGEKYYIQKIKPIHVNHRRYFEVTFISAKDRESKAGRVIAFTKLPVMGNYASRFRFQEESIQILGKTMPVLLIVGWEVSLRGCEFKNFSFILTGKKFEIQYGEQRAICRFLTEKRFTLTEIMDFPEGAYQKIMALWRSQAKTGYFFYVLDKCRSIIRSEKPGQNVLRYLLYGMHNAIIKSQWQEVGNSNLSGLYLSNKSIPFDKMPFIQSPVNHNPRLAALFECIPTKKRKHELLARQLRNNTEIAGRMFTPIEELEHYGDIRQLAKTYNSKLWFGHIERSKIVIEDNYAFINEYKLDTCEIIKKLVELSKTEDPEYSDEVEFWLLLGDYEVDCQEKIDILTKMFSKSAVAVIYGSAGVGKSTLINHVSHFYEDKEKLFLAQTNPAIDNLKRRVTADPENCKFSTIASFLKYGTNDPEYDLLVIDECSTVSNKDMRQLLEIVKFKRILLVGDTYQINSIRFGNWFTALRSFLPKTSVFELTTPYRTTNQRLLILWSKVRAMDDNVQEIIDKQSYSLKVDESLLTAVADDEAVLCLNYDGLYGINNINRFLQESNPNPPVEWGVQQYKVGDPVLFLENNRFHPVIYNNMRGKIVGVEKLDTATPEERIQFDIELYTTIDPAAVRFMPLEIVDNPINDNTIVRFSVYKVKSTDEDDDGNTARTIVPFQIAYAVSIHKAQGLEYDSVKIVITDEVDELITHNIFYTAITRAKNKLKIYWTPEVEKKVLERIRPRNIDADVEVLRKYL
jgi:GTPase SAR1 family protein